MDVVHWFTYRQKRRRNAGLTTLITVYKWNMCRQARAESCHVYKDVMILAELRPLFSIENLTSMDEA